MAIFTEYSHFTEYRIPFSLFLSFSLTNEDGT